MHIEHKPSLFPQHKQAHGLDGLVSVPNIEDFRKSKNLGKKKQNKTYWCNVLSAWY